MEPLANTQTLQLRKQRQKNEESCTWALFLANFVTAFDGPLPAVQAMDQWGRCSVALGIPRAHFC